MKNFILPVIIIAVAGLIGFSMITKQPITKTNQEIKTGYIKTNQQENLRQATLKIDGMFCVSCATGIEYALKEKEGVVDASVDYDNEKGKVIYNPQKISKDEIIQAVKPYTSKITGDVIYK